jgi:hypothetical protein
MRFVIDLDSLELIESATDRRRVAQVEGKRGDDSPFEVAFVRSGVAEELAASTVLTFGAKQEGKYDSAAVVLEDGFTLSGTGPSAKYAANPSFNTAALNALFLIDADASNDPPYVDLMAEFTWQVEGGSPTSTKTFRFRVHNDVVRDDELSPTPAYSPIGTTAPINQAKATGTITFTGQPTTGETVTIGGVTYTAQGSGPAFLTDFIIGANFETTAQNLLTAINTGNGYGGGTGHPLVSATRTGGVLTITADSFGSAGNDIGLSETATNVTVSAAYLAGGVTGTNSPPYIRVAGGFLYIQEAGVWKKTELSAL